MLAKNHLGEALAGSSIKSEMPFLLKF